MAAFIKFAPNARQRLAQVLCVSAATGTLCSTAYIGVQTWGLERLKQYNAIFSPTGELVLSQNIKEKIEEIYKELPISDLVKEKVKYFETFKDDFFNGGMIHTNVGAAIGIPGCFKFKDTSTMNRDNIRMFNLPIDWSKKDANDYVNSLVIPDQAQKAAILFQMMKAEANEPAFQAILINIAVTLASLAYFSFRIKYDNKNGRLALIMSAFLLAYLLAKDYISREIERKCDDKVAAFGDQYIEGSAQYLEKTLERNIAARSLLLDLGKRTYTEEGNLNFTFRSRHAPLTDRRNFFKSRMEELGN